MSKNKIIEQVPDNVIVTKKGWDANKYKDKPDRNRDVYSDTLPELKPGQARVLDPTTGKHMFVDMNDNTSFEDIARPAAKVIVAKKQGTSQARHLASGIQAGSKIGGLTLGNVNNPKVFAKTIMNKVKQESAKIKAQGISPEKKAQMVSTIKGNKKDASVKANILKNGVPKDKVPMIVTINKMVQNLLKKVTGFITSAGTSIIGSFTGSIMEQFQAARDRIKKEQDKVYAGNKKFKKNTGNNIYLELLKQMMFPLGSHIVHWVGSLLVLSILKSRSEKGRNPSYIKNIIKDIQLRTKFIMEQEVESSGGVLSKIFNILLFPFTKLFNKTKEILIWGLNNLGVINGLLMLNMTHSIYSIFLMFVHFLIMVSTNIALDLTINNKKTLNKSENYITEQGRSERWEDRSMSSVLKELEGPASDWYDPDGRPKGTAAREAAARGPSKLPPIGGDIPDEPAERMKRVPYPDEKEVTHMSKVKNVVTKGLTLPGIKEIADNFTLKDISDPKQLVGKALSIAKKKAKERTPIKTDPKQNSFLTILSNLFRDTWALISKVAGKIIAMLKKLYKYIAGALKKIWGKLKEGIKSMFNSAPAPATKSVMEQVTHTTNPKEAAGDRAMRVFKFVANKFIEVAVTLLFFIGCMLVMRTTRNWVEGRSYIIDLTNDMYKRFTFISEQTNVGGDIFVMVFKAIMWPFTKAFSLVKESFANVLEKPTVLGIMYALMGGFVVLNTISTIILIGTVVYDITYYGGSQAIKIAQESGPPLNIKIY